MPFNDAGWRQEMARRGISPYAGYSRQEERNRVLRAGILFSLIAVLVAIAPLVIFSYIQLLMYTMLGLVLLTIIIFTMALLLFLRVKEIKVGADSENITREIDSKDNTLRARVDEAIRLDQRKSSEEQPDADVKHFEKNKKYKHNTKEFSVEHKKRDMDTGQEPWRIEFARQWTLMVEEMNLPENKIIHEELEEMRARLKQLHNHKNEIAKKQENLANFLVYISIAIIPIILGFMLMIGRYPVARSTLRDIMMRVGVL